MANSMSVLPPVARERYERLKDALRFRRMAARDLTAKGFDTAAVYRWVRKGDDKGPPRRGEAVSTSRLALALGVAPEYLRPAGPTLWIYDNGDPVIHVDP